VANPRVDRPAIESQWAIRPLPFHPQNWHQPLQADLWTFQQLGVGLPGNMAQSRDYFRQQSAQASEVYSARCQQLLQRHRTRLLLLVILPGAARDQPQLTSIRGQTPIGVINAQMKAELGP